MGGSYVGEMHTHPANPCKHAIPRFFRGDNAYHLYTLV